MANIGYINKTDEGGLVGKIDTLAFSATIGLRRFMSDNAKAPKYEVMALTAARTWVKIGALFEQSIRSSGESFYQGRIDDPSMSRPMDIALFAKEGGGYDIAWTRRRARQDAPDSGEPAVPPMDDAAPEAQSGGLGDSTAPDAPQGGRGRGAAGKGGEAADKQTA